MVAHWLSPVPFLRLTPPLVAQITATFVALLLLAVLRRRAATSPGWVTGRGTWAAGSGGSSDRRVAYTPPDWASPVPVRDPLDEPYCVRYLRYEEPDSEPGAKDTGEDDHDTCYEPFPVGEDDTGTGMCVCAARAVRLDYGALNAARKAQVAGASDASCSLLCRLLWEEERCPEVPAVESTGGMAAAAAGKKGRWQQRSGEAGRAVMPQPSPKALHSVWFHFERAFRTSGGLDVVAPPGTRGFGGNPDVDWVARGEAMSAADVATARRQWVNFVAHMPPYPAAVFHGRGIVLTGGGMRYMVPLLVSIKVLRATGCALPIDAWFFDTDMPPPQPRAQLEAQGVAVRNVDEIRPGASRDVFKYGARGFGYVLKAAILLFSSCEECLYLDSDNLAISDPTSLFTLPQFQATGMVLWPDYWKPSVAPDMFRIAPEAAKPNTTVDSGQVLYQKRVTWRALLLALFMNCQGSLYYNLLTNYLGAGDKETFPMAMRMLRLPYHDVGHAFPTGSVGFTRVQPRGDGAAPGSEERVEFLSNTMVQYHPATGQPLLFHSNLNKFDLKVSTDWDMYMRRWQVITPVGWRVSDPQLGPPLNTTAITTEQLRRDEAAPPRLLPVESALTHVGFDAERLAWEEITRLRCAPWLAAYLQRLGTPGDVERQYDNFPRGYGGMLLHDHATGRMLETWAT